MQRLWFLVTAASSDSTKSRLQVLEHYKERRAVNWLCATPKFRHRSGTEGKAQLAVHQGLIRDFIVPSRGFDRTEE